jgi:hypothetical protein
MRNRILIQFGGAFRIFSFDKPGDADVSGFQVPGIRYTGFSYVGKPGKANS